MCSHVTQSPVSSDDIFGSHCADKSALSVSADTIQNCMDRSRDLIKDAYELCRHVAKQILVVMMSDLDREFKAEVPHAAPVAYALCDNSVTTKQMHDILAKVRLHCKERNLFVAAECYDGAFSKLAVRGVDNEPLTLLQLSKDVFAAAKSLSKSEQLKKLSSSGLVNKENIISMVCIEALTERENGMSTKGVSLSYRNPDDKIPETPRHLKDIVGFKGKATNVRSCVVDGIDKNENEDSTCMVIPSSEILPAVFPEDVEPSSVDNDDDDLGSDFETCDVLDDTDVQQEQNEITPVNWDACCQALEAYRSSKQGVKRRESITTDLKALVENTDDLLKCLTRDELFCLAKNINPLISTRQSMKKTEIADVIQRYIRGEMVTKLKKPTKSPKTLRSIAKQVVNKLPKSISNVVFAQQMFPPRLREWKAAGPFEDRLPVNETEMRLPWYSQPKFLPDENRYIFSFLDPEHILTNARTKVCSSGIPQLGITREAWVTVARCSNENKCGLSPALVEDLVDKQNCSFAEATFSGKVENAMRECGYSTEADFCRRLRNWYKAQDDPGITALARHDMETEMKDFLLSNVDFDQFPPPGSHINDMPITMFEGLLIHCDRRVQLYSFTRSGTYNPRSIGTLDNENFFGAFQDFDQRGTGILRCDEVPKAMMTACELFETRLNSQRGFFMHTSKAKVYPVKELLMSEDDIHMDVSHITQSKEWAPPLRVLDITISDHPFDMSVRAERKPKRKRSEITPTSEPARGTVGVRSERFRLNESKIPAHVREGISSPWTS